MTRQSEKRLVMVVLGTRPDAIKLAPVVQALADSDDLRPFVAATGQHRDMLDPVLQHFGIVPDVDADLLQPGQTLTDITTRALERLSTVVEQVRPDVVLVQGDTTTALAGALAGFYQRASVAHLEAGLRTGDLAAPFPEEGNRRMITQLGSLHLAPTTSARRNLEREGVDPRAVVVTGNTVIDALHWTAAELDRAGAPPVVDPAGREVVLVTVHRRESWGGPLEEIAAALAELAEGDPDVLFVLPVHANPLVRRTLLPILEGRPNVVLLEPQPYPAFVGLLRCATVVLTDSGGIQEEAPSLGKPVLVMREVTERPEAIEAGTVRLVGTDRTTIVDEVRRVLHDEAAHAAMARAVNPYGDGQAARRAVAALAHHLGRGPRPDEFSNG